MSNRKQMIGTPQGCRRKPLQSLTQQQNNSNAHSHLSVAPSSTKSNCKQLVQRKASLKTTNSETKVARKVFDSQNDKESGNKCGKYYENFERSTDEMERQELNCQNYFLRKTIMALYKLFEKSQIKWDLYGLTYAHLVKIMHWLGYIRSEGIQGMSEKVSEDLKKCYWIWVNLIQGKTFSLCNLIVVLCCIEHIQYDGQLIEEIVRELSKGIDKFEASRAMEDPKYIFFVKNQKFTFDNGALKLQRQDIVKIQAYLKDLRYNKLMENPLHSQPEKEEQPNYVTLSKKTEQLAENKRSKIVHEIRRKQPNVEEIQLHHLLNYKASYAKQRPLRTQYLHYQSQNKQKKDRTNNDKKASHTEYLMEKPQKKKKVIVPTFKPVQKGKNNEKISQKIQKPTRIPIEDESRYEDLSQIESSSSHELFTSCQPQSQIKQQIIEQLQWQQIPKHDEQLKMQSQLLEFKDDFVIQQPLCHTFSKPLPEESKDKQRKRKEYLDLPILFVDVNIQEGRKQRIVIYQGDQASDLANQFGKRHTLTPEMIERLQSLLQMQIGSILTKIDEANEQDCSQLY